MSAKSPVVVEDLRKSYGRCIAVDGVSFAVRPGEIFGIVGPNGAGKTTIVECLTGLRTPDSGSIRVLGLDPRSQGRALRTRIGIQLQEAALPDDIRVWEALRFFASLYPAGADCGALLVTWGLEGKRNARFAALSGGQKQRLFIALALVNNPEMLFLDELTSGLDPQARRSTWGLIDSLRDQGRTVVLVTHAMDEAETLCDRVAIVSRGSIVALDSPKRLIKEIRGKRRTDAGRLRRQATLEDVFLSLTGSAEGEGTKGGLQ